MRKTTRRALSVSAKTYLRWREFCETQGEPMSRELEKLIHEKLDAAGAPPIDDKDPRIRQKREDKKDGEKKVGGIWTF